MYDVPELFTELGSGRVWTFKKPPPTTFSDFRICVRLAAAAFPVPPSHSVYPSWILKLGGIETSGQRSCS